MQLTRAWESYVFGWLRKFMSRVNSLPGAPTLFDMSLFEGSGLNLYRSLAKFWGQSASRDAHAGVEELERRYALHLPDDFKDYLLFAAPNQSFTDGIGTQWWSVDEIKNIPDECSDVSPGTANPEIENERDTYLIFADYLIWCYAWAICCSDGQNRGRIAVIGGGPDGFVADSFREFLALVLNDANQIHPGFLGK